jgi:hypothetical protein
MCVKCNNLRNVLTGKEIAGETLSADIVIPKNEAHSELMVGGTFLPPLSLALNLNGQWACMLMGTIGMYADGQWACRLIAEGHANAPVGVLCHGASPPRHLASSPLVSSCICFGALLTSLSLVRAHACLLSLSSRCLLSLLHRWPHLVTHCRPDF